MNGQRSTRLAIRFSNRRQRLRRGTRSIVTLSATGVLLLATAACGSGTGSTAVGSAEDAATISKSASARLDHLYAGTDRALPTTSPAPAKGKNVWIITCGQTAEGCASGARGATDAGKLLGWKMTTVDGKFNPQTWNSGIRQAIAAKADAVMLALVDCGPVKSSLDAAHKAGLKVFAWYAFDCDTDNKSEAKRFDAEISFGKDFPTETDFFADYGASMADYIIAKTDGKAKIIQFTHKELKVVVALTKGFNKRIAECTSCEVLAKQDITLADLGTTLQQKATTLLNRFPQANAVLGMYDSAISLGIGAAVESSGRKDKLIVTGGEGFAPNLVNIRDNKGQDAAFGLPSTWVGWASVDGLNRLFAGEPQVDAGVGHRIEDKDNNLSDVSKSYDGTKDYRANYKKIWGLGS